MKKQIRKGLFETNSSSTHSIVVGNNGENVYDHLPYRVIFEGGDFGWETDVFKDTHSKASYLYTCIVENEQRDYIDKIKEILDKWGVKYEFEELNEKGRFKEYHYVDHSYEARGLVEKLCENEDLLMNYLFSDGSFVETGNDNDDEWIDEPYPLNVLMEYDKGN